MTNRELLRAPRHALTPAERQRLHLIRQFGTVLPGPACGRRIDGFEAAHLDIDDYDFGVTEHVYVCRCGVALKRVVQAVTTDPTDTGWRWELLESDGQTAS